MSNWVRPWTTVRTCRRDRFWGESRIISTLEVVAPWQQRQIFNSLSDTTTKMRMAEWTRSGPKDGLGFASTLTAQGCYAILGSNLITVERS